MPPSTAGGAAGLAVARPRRPCASGRGSAARRRRRPGPSSRTAVSCQPSPSRGGWSFESSRFPDSAVRSIPPTNAVSSSTTTSFSWWQWNGRSRASSAMEMRVPPASSSHACRTSLAVRVEERQRRARPGEDPHVDSLRRLGQELAQRRPVLLEPERGVEVPAGEVDVRARRADRVRDARQRLGPVEERLDAAAGARRERCGPRPAAVGRRIDRLRAAAAPQPPGVVGANGPLDRLADEIVEAVQGIRSHDALMPAPRRNLTRSARRTCCRCRCR